MRSCHKYSDYFVQEKKIKPKNEINYKNEALKDIIIIIIINKKNKTKDEHNKVIFIIIL